MVFLWAARLPVAAVRTAVVGLSPSLGPADTALEAAAVALMTTDTRAKVATVTVALPRGDGASRPVVVTGLAKGVGMIHPRMATMLSIILTDADVGPDSLWAMLRGAAARTWDRWLALPRKAP